MNRSEQGIEGRPDCRVIRPNPARTFTGMALIGLALAGLGPPRTALAQQEAGTPAVRLTLDDAITLARSANPAYQQAVNNLELNDVENREFWLGFLPQPQINFLRTSMVWNRATVGTDNFGNPIPNPDTRMIQSGQSDQFASLNFEVNLGDLYQRQKTKLTARTREVTASLAGDDLAANVRAVFLDAQEGMESRDLEESLTQIRAVNREITERLFRLAQRDRADLLSAEIDEVDQENQLEGSRAGLETALLDLRSLIGDPELGEIEIVPEPLRIFDPAGLDPEAIVGLAVGSGPRVREAELTVESAEKDVSLSRTEWLPTVSLSAYTGRSELSRDSGSGFFQLAPDGAWDRTFRLTLTFPDLGRYFLRGADGHRQEIEVRNAQAALRDQRLQVEQEVRSIILDLENQYRTVDVQQRRASLAHEQLELQQERYRLGQVDYLDLQASVETVSDAERGALQARYAFERALIDLERAIGGSLADIAGVQPAD